MQYCLLCSLTCESSLALCPPVHYGKPSMQKSEKIISLNKALDMRVTTELVRAWGGMKGNVIKS